MISEFPLFVFTALGSIAAGAYVAVVLLPLGNGSAPGSSSSSA